MKLCPFRKKRIAVALNEWEEHFQECCQERCAMWVGNNCGFIQANAVITPPVEVPDGPPNTKSDTELKNSTNSENGDLLEATVKVLEAKETKNPGSIRAWCQFEDGNKEAVFGKNGAGKNLLGAIGKQIKIKYRRLQDGTAFAVFVTAAAQE